VVTAVAFWVIGIALIVAQTTLLQFLPDWLGRPDFLYIFIAFLAYRFVWVSGILLVFSLGWVMDVVTSIQLGYYPLVCLITFAVLKLLSDNKALKETTYQIPLVGISYFFVQMLLHFSYSVVSPENLPEWSWGRTLQQTALLMVSAIPIFVLCNSFFEYLERRLRMARKTKRRVPRKR
jgi:rod shape-determining protein MreD